jgi:two-component system, LuxR family, sensor kinase FixL
MIAAVCLTLALQHLLLGYKQRGQRGQRGSWAELLFSMAHELNQPLAAILSDAQAAQRFLDRAVPDVDEVRAILHDIIAADRRASEVICRLRGLLQRGELRREPLSLNEVVHEVLKLLRNDLLNRQILVQTALTADLPLVYGDRVQLQQVLINLIVNGCDAMLINQVDRRTLRVSTAQTTECRLKVGVADQGPGVPSEQRENIFMPFFTTKVHGMGMGLAVCRMIITAHHGELWTEGTAEGGAGFYFSVPAYKED